MPQTRKPASKQVRVRVNAWVDERVAPVIEALNDFPDLVTLGSHAGTDGQNAWVSFAHRQLDTNETLAFIQFLANELQSRIDNEVGCRVGLEWEVGNKNSMAKIEAPMHAINDLATVLSEVASGELVN